MINYDLKWPNHPKIYEINTWPWLKSLSDIYGHQIKLDSIPVEFIDKELYHFDVVWLMGVWERSPKGRDIALNHEGLQEEYKNALRYYNTEDVIGSPYSVYYYHVDNHLGGKEALASFRKDLADRGILLILDYVPNHVSKDHLWTLEKSDLFIKGTIKDQMSKPYDYFSLAGTVFAHGKDPNFPAWSDTVQINAFSSEARSKATNTLINIAEQCDGVRCDMAMLMINEVFSRTWGVKAGSIQDKEYWEEIIPSIKQKFPSFKFLAEVYWDLEWALMQQGFDYCYDKRLYERLVNKNPIEIRKHLEADWEYQKKLIRYIENHDEKRAPIVFGNDAAKAAAVIALTLPGSRLIFEGQNIGCKIKLPVQLGRPATEDKDSEISRFYENLLESIPGREYNDSVWSLCEVNSIGSLESSYNNIIAYYWESQDKLLITVVNYSTDLSKAHIKTNFDFGTKIWKFKDILNLKEYSYQGVDINEIGLYIELDPWCSHIFEISK
jgi:glycosidase